MRESAQWRRASLGAAALVLLAAVCGCAGTARQGALAAPRPALRAAQADDAAKFAAFLKDFRREALKAGIMPATYDRAVTGLAPNRRIQELNENQPEFVRPVWDYLAGAVSEFRVARGRELLATYAPMFDRLEQTYGVPRETLAAIWGLETAYGQNEGSFNLFQALATLAYDGPRQDYGRRQFIAALKIAEAEHLDPQMMTGSWAGAVGHTQFVPTTFLDHAVDGDGDGKRDLWNSPSDALASTGQYLKVSGWRQGQSWGEEVQLPMGFAYEQADPDLKKPESEWAKLGLRRATGEALGTGSDSAAIYLPAGARGPAFLVRDNFNAILKYNQAASYALAIGVLSDRLKGEEGVLGTWPRDEMPLSKPERVALQEGLEALGFPTGGSDGVLGRRTRAALRDYQKARGIAADGFPTTSLLTRILNERTQKRL